MINESSPLSDIHADCPICLDPVIQPYKTICDHTFCSQCLHDYFIKRPMANPQCPLCRQIIKEDKEKLAERYNDQPSEWVAPDMLHGWDWPTAAELAQIDWDWLDDISDRL